ncbi:nuclease [Novosphingobium marinum]|uniref:Putative endonuclease n=1 Tax=Novosphingobium marinum TaxID=1514948 RepID=A0A7Z0BVN1_9SPHN|nr:GIY-YIG nuclease family protein [Novosphingobium marinum]NYH95347.1 putative endonuclease [Novosphingobium marinum]GGC26322.1 nuclease [Novosphingobium marinum]
MKPGYVQILTNRPDGVTSDLANRVRRHRRRAVPGFTRKYDCRRLVRFERYERLEDARKAEVRMKKRRREWKLKRIAERNPGWIDLFDTMHLSNEP